MQAKHIISLLILTFPLFANESCSSVNKDPSCSLKGFQGDPLVNPKEGTFNIPAAIALNSYKGNCTPCITFFADASFLYWYGAQGGLTYATSGVINAGSLFQAVDNSAIMQSFEYEPGFKVGIGAVIHQDWVLSADYTWLKGDLSGSQAAPGGAAATSGGSILIGTPVWVVQDWFLQGTTTGQGISATNIASKWSYKIDLFDAVAGRPYYQGPTLTINPFLGLRGALIRQKVDVALTEISGQSGLAAPTQPINSNTKSDSWGVGPRIGFDANYLFPHGFRLDGNLGASLLYTRYTKISHSEDRASTTFNVGPYAYKYSNYDTVSPIAELGLGIGWGRYCYAQKAHIDFSASYDFLYFWSQNMMRKMLGEYLTGSASSAEDLYFHGLTVSARIDF